MAEQGQGAEQGPNQPGLPSILGTGLIQQPSRHCAQDSVRVVKLKFWAALSPLG